MFLAVYDPGIRINEVVLGIEDLTGVFHGLAWFEVTESFWLLAEPEFVLGLRSREVVVHHAQKRGAAVSEVVSDGVEDLLVLSVICVGADDVV